MTDEHKKYIPPKNEEESISRREQFLDSGFERWSMDDLEKQIFGFVVAPLLTEKQLDKFLKEQEEKKKNLN